MRCIVKHHFQLNRILLLAIGLWPYQQSLLVKFQRILFTGILISSVIFQLTVFLTSDCTLDFVIKILSFVLFFMIFMIKYNSFWINSQAMRNLMEQLQNIYNELKDENEFNIMKKYGNNAKHYTARIIGVLMCSILIAFFVPIWSSILDIVLPMNESRSRSVLLLMTEYFVDQEKYFYLIFLHMYTAMFIGGIVIIGTGTMLIAYLKHACGIFTIASYRIEQAMTVNNLQNGLQNKIVIHKGIICAVDAHCKAIEFSKSLISSLEGLFFLLIGFNVICLSLNLFEMYQILIYGDAKEEFLIHFVIVIVILLYMFLANYAGQEIIDHNNHIFYTAYNVHWYAAPLHIQKLILFILQRGTKVVSLNVGGLFAASLNCFATLATASVSYFTFIYSTQQQ
ncbi:odorant receptor 4-like [Cataglyphis hispanica]|uniref:odorant receptor 4-like n=1 Tax=Cataglyphis hispanica TaxID=1086592 RepID=UPI00217F2FB6|nr:odorant receptor 4-like [Cataglyphis hispanica]